MEKLCTYKRKITDNKDVSRRLTLPKTFCDLLDIKFGDTVEVTLLDTQEIRVKKFIKEQDDV